MYTYMGQSNMLYWYEVTNMISDGQISTVVEADKTIEILCKRISLGSDMGQSICKGGEVGTAFVQVEYNPSG